MVIFGTYISLAVFWLAVAVIFLIIEAVTVGLLIVSFCLLLFTRKIFVEKLKTGRVRTNAEALIGETGRVTAQIRPLETGQVRIKGQEWSAVCRDETLIEKGTFVKVIAIEGVKLIVVPESQQ